MDLRYRFCLAILLMHVCVALYGQKRQLLDAYWIIPGYTGDSAGAPCLVFQKTFETTSRIKSAKLYITSYGLYEAHINGGRVSEDYFTPGYTNYPKRLQYQVYNVTPLLKVNNTITVTVADGWWRGKIRGGGYGKDASLLSALEITYENSKKEVISTDSSWRSTTGQIRFSDIYDGETINTTLTTKKWYPVKLAGYPKDNLIPTAIPPVRKQERFAVKRIIHDSILDFGQNMAGWVSCKLNGKKGDTVRLQFAETLDSSGKDIYTKSLRTAKATDTYILNSKEMQTLEPHFSYHGFRYVKISGYKLNERNKKDFEAVALYSDLEKTGTFFCSDTLLNRLYQNIVWSMNSNFFDIPTDCPQRSERMGWTGDARAFCPTACYIRDVKSFYAKWLDDMAAEQGNQGGIPDVVPTASKSESGGTAGWGDAATFVPWTLFQYYGDTVSLQKHYAMMKKWVDYVAAHSKGFLWTANGYGDWCGTGEPTPIEYIDQCFWYRSTDIVLNAAKVLNRTEDIEKYMKLKDSIQAAFDKTCLNRIPQTQTAYALGLSFGLLDSSHIQGLVQLIHKNNDHLTTGFLGTPLLLPVLSRYGETALAYKILMQLDYPGWLYMVKQGATTMWEKWNAVKEDGSPTEASLNHYIFGSVGEWFYETICGIEPIEPGFKKIRIAPKAGGGLTYAEASFKSKCGKIVSKWSIQGNQIIMNVTIPIGTTAEIHIPGVGVVNKGPSSYRFTGHIIPQQ